jgi:hypothetical protein
MNLIQLYPSVTKKSYLFRHNNRPFLYQEIYDHNGELENTKWKVLVTKNNLSSPMRDKVLLDAINYFKDNHPMFKTDEN